MADGSPRQSDGSPNTAVRPLQFGWGRHLPMILQTEATECALACLTMIASYHGHDVDLAGLRRRFPTSLKGSNLAQLMSMASALHMSGRPLRLDMDELSKLNTPCVLHWELNHFVVLKKVDKRGIVIHDPARGERRLTFAEASAAFTGIALELLPAAGFEPVQQRLSVSLRQLTGTMHGVVPFLVQIALLALALEAFALTSPFFMQWIMDQVLPSADRDLLTLLCLGFLTILALQIAVGAARSWAVTVLGMKLGVQWVGNVVGHMLRLPLDWFEKRHVGDVVSRLGSIQAIQRTLTTQFIGALLDGLMSVITLIVLLAYSPSLTAIVVGLFITYALIRWAIFGRLRRLNEDQIIYAARQQSELLESIRGVLPIKLYNQEEERRARYMNAVVDTTNRDIRIQRFSLAFGALNQILFGVGRVALIWIGALRALDGSFSAGMLVAFIAYADQFTSRAGSLVDKWIDFRMLKLHTERLADIALSAPEPQEDIGWDGELDDAGIELRNVSFRYADDEPWVIRHCNLRIGSGESVAIIGPSGCGKTTLAKLMLGLLEPQEGEILFGGVPIRKLGLSRYRAQIGAVMQEDQLFAGSIADNIAFFDHGIDQERVQLSARWAAIASDIAAMPMGYQTLVGDMGSSLSGGQRQRVLLARALYRRPRLLLLDEATSHLDINREKQVNEAIKHLRTTRIVIAHRPETIASADRVIDLWPKPQN
ncbi:peptidase domain-containing ABC transporter [Luteimonas panaciterrae]|uniref:peptidase domain-containing ABC transporter n=1 Tax=Luteimonas panaciterrae TaxID=363885 RepID=UPI001CFB3DAE|nr:peptidase domain-containing ABC transporter [Luteimonas panaciterrae]